MVFAILLKDMYSGTTLRDKSGRLMGVHQKIDRVARKHLKPLLPEDVVFPSYAQIVHLEGKNGPDGIKRKSPAIDEPWHFIDPNKLDNAPLLDTVDEHLSNLSDALSINNQQRAAFEAAWLAHAITDGLTPAHHFPLEETLKELRLGQGLETRDSFLKKNIMIGENAIETVRNNWRFWGAKGAMTMHGGFEFGVASVVAYKKFPDGMPRIDDMSRIEDTDFRTYFIEQIKEVASLEMYENFAKHGWTTKLARQTNEQLMPLIIRTVTVGWLLAAWMSNQGHS